MFYFFTTSHIYLIHSASILILYPSVMWDKKPDCLAVCVLISRYVSSQHSCKTCSNPYCYIIWAMHIFRNTLQLLVVEHQKLKTRSSYKFYLILLNEDTCDDIAARSINQNWCAYVILWWYARTFLRSWMKDKI